MDEKIQSILDQAMTSQPTESSSDPVANILSEAGVTPLDQQLNPQPQQSLQDQMPADYAQAEQKLGNPDDNGFCERFVEKMTGKGWQGSTAVGAWNNYVKQGKAFTDVTKAPRGALIYYAPDQSNGEAGHVAITDGKGNQIGATYNGVQLTPINQWMQQTGQKPLGFVLP